ncbi:MAG: MYXO-CTERM sorting domain-containing protein, partial [Proteobacteria bacterium]|nr:MYXO-CTERM sorting domain-containing protein [Pseudomonadota bacterium]
NSFCTGVCDADGTCPGGYQCLQTGAAPVCWPSPDDGGGCSTSGDRGSLVMLLGLGAALTLRRKRA